MSGLEVRSPETPWEILGGSKGIEDFSKRASVSTPMLEQQKLANGENRSKESSKK